MWKYGEKGDKSCPQPMERAGKVKKEFFARRKFVAIIEVGKTLQKFFSNRCNKIARPRINQVERGRPS